MEISHTSITVTPNEQFTVSCTARAEIDGQIFDLYIAMKWKRLNYNSTVTVLDAVSTYSDVTGYQSILTTSETGTDHTIVYHCTARASWKQYSTSAIKPVYVEGAYTFTSE